MSTSYHRVYLASLVLLVTVFASNASFCNNLTSVEDRETPCFLAPSTNNPVLLSTSSNSLVLPCHVARSKQSLVEWWYSDPQKLLNIKIYPVYPPVRPTVLRFATSLTPYSKNLNETDIIDASILLPYVNVDDSGTYRCVIRPLPSDPLEQMENLLFGDDTKTSSLVYNVKLTGARLCHSNPGTLPCFTAMRTSSPTIIDAYQTSFLQCVVKSFNRPASVFWVVGDAVENALIINNYLLSNQYNGDKLRRIFPRSITDYSIELTLGPNMKERIYSCVIDGASDQETTIFTYIVRNLDVERTNMKTLNGTHDGEQNIHRVDHGIDHLHSSSDSPAASGEVSENLGENDLTEDEQQETTTSI